MKKLHYKSFIAGLVAALALPLALVGFLVFRNDYHTIYHDTVLPSGRSIKVISYQLVFGIDHSDRLAEQDSFALEYISSLGNDDETGMDQETREVFEFIRPTSEQWGFKQASVASFPKAERKGKYYLYNFRRLPEGSWTYERELRKVFIND